MISYHFDSNAIIAAPYQHVAVFKTLYDGSVGKESVFVGAWLEGRGNDGIGIKMIWYHYVMVTTSLGEREALSIISVQFSDVFHLDM